jgi:phenylglyoxylate dehydrogenase beta subunit
MSFDVLSRRDNICPPGCVLCEEACSKRSGAKIPHVIRHIDLPEVHYNGIVTCIQCSEPECLEICPSGAITKSAKDGVVRIDEGRCVGCGMCTLACPYGGLTYHSSERKAVKCDLCGGRPECVNVCPVNVIELVRNRDIERYLSKDQFLSPGTRACPGCAAELSYRSTQRLLGTYEEVVIFGCPGCMTILMNGFGTMPGSRMSYVSCLFTNVFSSMTGMHRYFRHKDRDVKLVAFVGDGCVSDVSFQTLSAAAERGENIVAICYDNEGYQNTGNQKSSTTPKGAKTYTSPVGKTAGGKRENSKNVPLIMVSHNIPYVATATTAYTEDYLRKLTKALKVEHGMAYIHLLTPCPPGWGIPGDSAIEFSRLAVETGYFPLWEYENEKLNFTYEPKAYRPVSEFIKAQGRFSHLKKEDVDEFQRLVDKRFKHIAALSAIGQQ